MTSVFYKKLVSNNKWVDSQRQIAAAISITFAHIISILFYCNFTDLCTVFSQTFRSTTDSTTKQELIFRHSNFREWGRLLRETVEAFGTSFNDSDVGIFYHGISMEMVFASTVAHFRCPTSTTTSLSVACNFAKDGIILELLNDYNLHTYYFDCKVLSNHSNESECLLIGGAEPVSICNIRHIGLKIAYKPFIEAITILQFLIKGQYSVL
jgi:hypothetical protein